MVFRFALFVDLIIDYQPATFQCSSLSGSSFTEGLEKHNISSLTHFIFLGVEICIFCETDHKL